MLRHVEHTVATINKNCWVRKWHSTKLSFVVLALLMRKFLSQCNFFPYPKSSSLIMWIQCKNECHNDVFMNYQSRFSIHDFSIKVNLKNHDMMNIIPMSSSFNFLFLLPNVMSFLINRPQAPKFSHQSSHEKQFVDWLSTWKKISTQILNVFYVVLPV